MHGQNHIKYVNTIQIDLSF